MDKVVDKQYRVGGYKFLSLAAGERAAGHA